MWVGVLHCPCFDQSAACPLPTARGFLLVILLPAVRDPLPPVESGATDPRPGSRLASIASIRRRKISQPGQGGSVSTGISRPAEAHEDGLCRLPSDGIRQRRTATRHRRIQPAFAPPSGDASFCTRSNKARSTASGLSRIFSPTRSAGTRPAVTSPRSQDGGRPSRVATRRSGSNVFCASTSLTIRPRGLKTSETQAQNGQGVSWKLWA